MILLRSQLAATHAVDLIWLVVPQALDGCAERYVVHHDVKEDNVILTKDGVRGGNLLPVLSRRPQFSILWNT
jgi:Ser/Thr protein kinase RdoA (MazF antagonist)